MLQYRLKSIHVQQWVVVLGLIYYVHVVVPEKIEGSYESKNSIISAVHTLVSHTDCPAFQHYLEVVDICTVGC